MAALFGAEYDSAGGHQMLVTNVGALANAHPAVAHAVPGHTFEPLLDRCFDPGAGAFTDVVGQFYTTTTATIAEGEELFVSYGDEWFASRPEFSELPTKKDYEGVEEAVQQLVSRLGGGVEDEAILAEVLAETKPEARVATEEMMRRALTTRNRSFDPHTDHCLDGLEVRVSTVKQAGRGAFSRKHFQAGDVILSSPMMHTLGASGPGLVGKDDRPSLLMNYHFGYGDLYLLPTTSLTAVNHRREPNAELRFATWNRKSNYFLRRPLEDLRRVTSPVLVVDLVALADIQEGDEIFIDYGEDWEAAWQHHVANWSSPCDSSAVDPVIPSSAVGQMNRDKHNSQYHAWSSYHMTVCITNDRTRPIGDVPRGGSMEIGSSITVSWDDEAFPLSQTPGPRVPCRILASNGDGSLDVLLFEAGGSGDGERRAVFRNHNLPDESVFFVHKPMTSDQFDPKSFRHSIGIPGHIIPDLWKA